MKKIIIFLAIFFTTTIILNAAKKEVIVKVKDSLETSAKEVRLKDIGLVIGDNRLNNIVILKFQNNGDSFLINKQLIFNSILNFYITHKETVPEIKIFSKNVIKIKRKTYFITYSKIEHIIKNFLKENEKKIFGNKSWKLVKVLCPEKVKINSNKVDIKVTLLDEKNFYRLPFIIDFLNNNIKVKSIRIFVITEVKDKIVVAKRNIPIKKIITIDDLKISEVAVKQTSRNYIQSISKVVGRMSRRFIREGEPITNNMIKLPPLVNRGDIVTVIAQSGNGIVISTKGKALENGYYNKNIRVLNVRSGKVFLATVKGYGKVIVNF